MADGYSWDDARNGGTYRLPGTDHLGWWASVAMLLSILLHVVVFLLLDRLNIGLDFGHRDEITTGQINVQPVEVTPASDETQPPDQIEIPPTNAASLLEEVDLLAKLPKDQDLDMKPDVLEAEYAIRLSQPAQEGAPDSLAPQASTGMEIEADLPDLGRMEEHLPPAAVGQIIVDPGAVQTDDMAMGKFTEDLLKKGANGQVKAGALDGLASLDDLLGLPANVLVGKKNMLPSDLLFEFNSAELRESAKVSLMKLGLLIDRNPRLYCWIEGHTDMVGGDDFNLDLSRRRAAAVREYLVKSLRMDSSKIIPYGKGKREPLVVDGTVDQQALNRRVEIRMRQSPPPPEATHIAPRAVPVAETPPAPPRAVLVRPGLAVPVEEPPPPRAEPVQENELPPIPRAEPVEPEDASETLRPLQVPRAEAVTE